ncbi:hypothetical protein [Pseudomonas purpurea]|uniref:hypothetical protein n=1 Tax=Pseudomonas purpurea TaxID=3136737 RepID=UPI0032657C6D
MKRDIEENAETIRHLHARIKKSVKTRDASPLKRREWELACQEFHARYEALSFPCDFREALQKIDSGDQLSVESALCFVELRPYFYRSGYMYKDLIRKLKNATLDGSHRERRDAIISAYHQWRAGNRT